MRVVDPREVELPDAGVMVMQDAETGEQLLVDTSDPGSAAASSRGRRQRERRS